MKRHCTVYLPHYMVPGFDHLPPQLPTTSTDKVDYQGLKTLAVEEAERGGRRNEGQRRSQSSDAPLTSMALPLS